MKGIAIFNLRESLNKSNNNYVLKSERTWNKFRGLIIKAKSEGQPINPADLNGKPVFFILTLNQDRNGNKRPYLFLYKYTKGLPEEIQFLHIFQLEEKETGFGAVRKHTLPQEDIKILLDQKVPSFRGTHWDRQFVVLGPEEIKVNRFYKSNQGNVKESVISL